MMRPDDRAIENIPVIASTALITMLILEIASRWRYPTACFSLKRPPSAYHRTASVSHFMPREQAFMTLELPGMLPCRMLMGTHAHEAREVVVATRHNFGHRAPTITRRRSLRQPGALASSRRAFIISSTGHTGRH